MSSSDSILPVSIRVNPFKEADLSHLPLDGVVPWSPYGRYLHERPSFTLDPFFHAGAYYVQDSSAMFAGWMFREALKLFPAVSRVADVCAAPGGKTTDVAASLRAECGNAYMLVANEVIRTRAAVLMDNVARWGDPNVVVTSSDPADFGRLPEFFDILVTDVPCSGEGMFRKNENARKMWSEENVALCAARSRRIVADVWPSLRPGGLLLYSTCTLNDDENDDNVEWMARELGARVVTPSSPFEGPVATKFGYVLTPGVVRGEGQYCALVQKDGTVRQDEKSVERGFPDVPFDDEVEFFSKDGFIYALPSYVAAQMTLVGKKLNVLGAGTRAFLQKGKDKVPYADLALSLLNEAGEFPDVPLTLEEALRFLHRDALTLHDAPNGYLTVSYGGLPLGFVKNIGNRANNLHPAPRRILMDVK